MNGSLSDREQKLLAAGLLVFILAAAWFAVVAPLKAGFDARRDRRDLALSRLHHDQRLIIGGQAQRAHLALTVKAAGPLTLQLRDPQLAQRLAQLRLARAASASGVKLVAVHATTTVQPLVRIEADARGDFAGLAALLQRLQDDAPAAQIDHLVEARSDSFQAQSGATPLDAHLSLTYAYRGAD